MIDELAKRTSWLIAQRRHRPLMRAVLAGVCLRRNLRVAVEESKSAVQIAALRNNRGIDL